MPLESGTLIPDLNQNNPLGADPKSEGDDHLRLVKRCVQGSFAAFVGTTAVPKSVSLTEDEINDAALKLAANSFSGSNTFNGLTTFNTQARLANNIPLSGRNVAGTVEHQLIKLNTGDQVEIGNGDQVIRLAGTIETQFRIDGATVAVALPIDQGGMNVRSRRNISMKAAFRNPETIANPSTLIQDYEGITLRFTGNGPRVLAVNALEQGTSIVGVVQYGTGQVELQVGTASLTWIDGGNSVGGVSLFCGPSSVFQLYWIAAGSCVVWGNGITT